MTHAAKMQAARVLQAVSHRWLKWRNARYYKRLPVGETFTAIYRSRAWGSVPDRPFCSGDGSIREEVVRPYTQVVRRFIEANDIRQIVDLGCGDFSVGSRLIEPGIRYTGVDVVPELIRYNQEHFASQSVEFRCMDIIEDDLPPGELCLVRQVLQHLSNEQILKTLDSLTRYPHVIATEHVYVGPGLRRNRDKEQGPGTRLPKRSGVFLEFPPFSRPAKLLLEVPLAEMEVLRTVVIQSI
ncbi:MAG: class I SAM-dependent methyltransferase [Acidobacteriaceae bacterium]